MKQKAAINAFKEQNVMMDMESQFEEEPIPSESEAVQQTPQSAVEGISPTIRAKTEVRKSPPKPPIPISSIKTSEELLLEKEPLKIKETGFWMFKTIIVPPNAYVVHTRKGKKEPITIGLGLSFSFNPYTDSYLVVPAAMQTIGIVANCISKEKQGINVLAYVQWLISDFSLAYKKLDFSDPKDPMAIVNAQLREQAEAAIKDKVATMSIEEVLTDKEPIIQELTERMKSVTEGRSKEAGSESDEKKGLGIKIVTVQIKEAVVSSQRVWENLQAPFRHQKQQEATISQLLMQEEIRKKELENRRYTETSEAETKAQIEKIKAEKETESFEARLLEEGKRFKKSQEEQRRKIQLEEETILAKKESERTIREHEEKILHEAQLKKMQREAEAQLEQTKASAETKAKQTEIEIENQIKQLKDNERLLIAKLESEQKRIEREKQIAELEANLKKLIEQHTIELNTLKQNAQIEIEKKNSELKLEIEKATNQIKYELALKTAEIEQKLQEIRNSISQSDLSARLIEILPELAKQMPKIDELRTIQISGSTEGAFDPLLTFITKVLALAESMGIKIPKKELGSTSI